MVVSPSTGDGRFPFNRRMSIRACTPPSHVSAARAHMIRNDEGPRQDTCRGPCDCPAVQRNGPFKTRCERSSSSWRRPSPGLPGCHVLLPPGRRCGCALGRRTRLLDAIAASGVHVFYAHATSSHWAGSSVPFIRCISRRAVPLARITWVLVRVDIRLRVSSLHSQDQSQNAQASDQSTLHQTSSLSTNKCHSFYWVPSTRIKSKRQRARETTFLAVSQKENLH